MNKYVWILAVILAVMTFFASTSSLALVKYSNDENGFFVSGFGTDDSVAPEFTMGTQGSFSSFGGFASPSADHKTGAFLRNFSAAGILSYYQKLVSDDDPLKGAQNIIKDYKNYLAIESMVEQEVQRAAESAAKELNASPANSNEEEPQSCEYISPGWKYFAAILPIIESEEQFESLFVITSSDKAPYKVSFDKMQQAAMKIAGGNGQVYLKGSLMYAYLLTVYNEHGRATSFKQPKVPSALKNQLIYPLESTIRIRKSWYAKRDGGARKHTGTDIHAKEGTEIYSCTDGTVLYIGFGSTPGYYVIIEDALGYEYHYYHMVRETDFLKPGDTVKAGELIGYVGNTGNSDVDHLHINILAPNGQYLNPYNLMISAKKRAN